MKTRYEENFIRSAIDPEMRAHAKTATIIWNIMKIWWETRGAIAALWLDTHADEPPPRPPAGDSGQGVFTEGKAVTDDHPLKRDNAQKDEALLERRQNVLSPHHSSVEQPQGRDHQHHQPSGRHDEERVGGLVRRFTDRAAGGDATAAGRGRQQPIALQSYRSSVDRASWPASCAGITPRNSARIAALVRRFVIISLHGIAASICQG